MPEIINNGFSPVVRTELYFLTVVTSAVVDPVAVYMRHGSPGHNEWWRDFEPIARFKTIEEARELIDKMAGLVEAHKHFPIVEADLLQ